MLAIDLSIYLVNNQYAYYIALFVIVNKVAMLFLIDCFLCSIKQVLFHAGVY